MEVIKQELSSLTKDKIVEYQENGVLFEHTPKQYIEYLNDTLDHFDFNKDFSYLSFIFLIVPHSLCASEITRKERKEILNLLKKIREKIQILILQKPGNISKNNPNFSLLKKLIDSTESLMIAQFYDLIEHYQGNSLELISYLLFEIKEYNLIEDIFEQYPYMIRLSDDNGITLFEKVINAYFEEIHNYTEDKKLTTNYNLIYYDRIIDLFLISEKFELEFKKEKDILSHINYCRKSINKEDYNNLTKRKFIYWLNHLEEKLIKKEHDITFKEICYIHDIKDGFDEGILSEARRLNIEVLPNRYPNRRLVRDEYILTIDGKNAEELDDALSITKLENGLYKIGIHIADPSSYLPKDSIILDGAYERSTSIYLPKHTISMFPEILAKDKMNLLVGKPRLAVSVYLYVNKEGKIENYEFLETIIRVNMNTTYSFVDNTLKNGYNKRQKFFETVTLLNEIVPKLRNNFKIDETYAFLNRTESNATKTNIIGNSRSNRIVETCMIMANYIIAYHMNKNNLPCINRVHKIDDAYLNMLERIQANLHSNDEREVNSLICYLKATYPKSKYSIDKTGHFGLGLPYYCHFTAPLRRSIDNAVKLQVLDPFYFHRVSDQKAYQIEEELKMLCNYTNERQLIVDSFMESIKKERGKILTKH